MNINWFKTGGIIAAVLAFLYYAKKFAADPLSDFVDETARVWYFSDEWNERAVSELQKRGYNANAWIARIEFLRRIPLTPTPAVMIQNGFNAVLRLRLGELLSGGPPVWESPPLWLETIRGKRFFESVTLTEAREWFQAQFDLVWAYYQDGGKA